MTCSDTSILIVEDEPAISGLLVALLGGRFYCQTAESAETAIGLLDTQRFHLVLADIGLPGTSGLDLCRLIGARDPKPPVVLISGKIDLEAESEARQAGAFDFLPKPFDLADVLTTVHCALSEPAQASAVVSANSD